MSLSPADQPDAQSDSGKMRWWVMGVLLTVGLAAWVTVGGLLSNWANQLGGLMTGVAVLVLAAIPAVRRVCVEGMNRLTVKLEKRIGLSAVVVAIVAAGYLTFTAMHQGRYLHPHWHDELSYVIQMRMLAQGKLWMPLHPCAEYFETFYLLNDRVYASIYFPGTALLYVPEIWLRLPLVAFPILAAGAAVGLTFWILAKLIDPISGLVGAMLMIGTPIVRLLSVMVMSNVPVLLMGLLLMIAFLKWQRERRMIWALLMGVFAGWAAVSRPLEATCFAVPIGIAILLRLRDWNWSKRLATLAFILAGAAPFLILQVVLNQNITGNWRLPAWQHYSNRDFPQTTMGFRKFDPSIRPVSKLPQKQKIYDSFVPYVVAAHQPRLIVRQWLDERLPLLLEGTMPYTVLVIFLPLGISLCGRRWRWVVAGVLPMFVFLYGISVVFQIYYPIVVIPSVLLLVLLGMKTIANALGRFSGAARAMLLLWAALMAFAALPETSGGAHDQLFDPKLMKQVDEWEAKLNGRALVLFRFDANRNLDQEPVYNATTARPDDAKVVRAQNLGANQKLFNYYAKTQPDRQVFLFDEANNSVKRLGTAAELAK